VIKINCDYYLHLTVRTFLFGLVVIFIFGSCSSSKLVEKKKQFERMPDKELLSYYHQLDNRLDDIDKNTENNKVVENNNYDPNRDRVVHLHIGDKWGQLKQEKKLVLRELRKRNITP
jgi:hypothetical protein